MKMGKVWYTAPINEKSRDWFWVLEGFDLILRNWLPKINGTLTVPDFEENYVSS